MSSVKALSAVAIIGLLATAMLACGVVTVAPADSATPEPTEAEPTQAPAAAETPFPTPKPAATESASRLAAPTALPAPTTSPIPAPPPLSAPTPVVAATATGAPAATAAPIPPDDAPTPTSPSPRFDHTPTPPGQVTSPQAPTLTPTSGTSGNPSVLELLDQFDPDTRASILRLVARYPATAQVAMRFPWLADGIDGFESSAIASLLRILQKAPGGDDYLAETLAAIHWLPDGISEQDMLLLNQLASIQDPGTLAAALLTADPRDLTPSSPTATPGPQPGPSLGTRLDPLDATWSQDGLNSEERLALESLQRLEQNYPEVGEVVLRLPWIADSINSQEQRALAAVEDIARTASAFADAADLSELVGQTPWLIDDITINEMHLLEELATYRNPARLAAALLTVDPEDFSPLPPTATPRPTPASVTGSSRVRLGPGRADRPGGGCLRISWQDRDPARCGRPRTGPDHVVAFRRHRRRRQPAALPHRGNPLCRQSHGDRYDRPAQHSSARLFLNRGSFNVEGFRQGVPDKIRALSALSEQSPWCCWWGTILAAPPLDGAEFGASGPPLAWI